MPPVKKLNPAITALIVIVLVGIVVAGVVAVSNSSKQQTTETTQTSDTESTPASVDAAINYKDGTYTETGSYSSPGGRESIEVTVTIANDIITSTTLVSNAKTGEAKSYQADFASGYKSLVVGKDIDAVSLSRVAGSSLTSNGFNTALELIKADAKA